MTTERLVNNALFGKTELASQKIELGLIDEISKELEIAFKQQDVESELNSVIVKMDKAIGLCNLIIQKGNKALTQIKELGISGGLDKKVESQIKEADGLKKSVDFRIAQINKVRK